MTNWFIQYNPDYYDVKSAMKDLFFDYWNVKPGKRRRKHSDELKKNELVLFWESGSNSGFVGFGHILKAIHKRRVPDFYEKYSKFSEDNSKGKLKEVIKISYDWIFKNKITLTKLKQDPNFSEEYLCNLGTPGTFFPSTEKAWDYFQHYLGDTNKCYLFDDINFWFGSPSPPTKKDDPIEEISGSFLEFLMKNDIFALGWPGFTEDLNDYTIKELESLMDKRAKNSEGFSDMAKKFYFRIKEELKIGDILIAKKGDDGSNPDNRIYGIGIVTSNYKYNDDFGNIGKKDYHNYHFRNVRWIFNFYNDFKNIEAFNNYYLDLKDLTSEKKVFTQHTLTPKNFNFFYRLKELLIKKLKNLQKEAIITSDIYENYIEKFDELIYWARKMKYIISKMKEFDENNEIKEKIEEGYNSLDEFKEKFPFKNNLNSIKSLKPEDFLIEREDGPDKLGSFSEFIENKTQSLASLNLYSKTYKNIIKNLDEFKALLYIAIDNDKSLAEKIDAEWGKISGLGSDKHIAKKIIFCFNDDVIPILNTKDLLSFFKNIYGDDGIPEDFYSFSKGKKYQFLTDQLLKFKNSNNISKDWSNALFSDFYFKMIKSEEDPFINNGNGFDNEDFIIKNLYFPKEQSDLLNKRIKIAKIKRKHIILIGPPGTGKSKLAKEICRFYKENDYIMSTATSDWSSFETIGGYRLADDGESLEFSPGLFLKCFRNNEGFEINKWLIIDEINRSDIDKAFGSLFSALTGDSITLPYEKDKKTVKVDGNSQNKEKQEDNYFTYKIPKDWKIIATMNTYDKTSLYEMSYAFMRRFAFIPVDIPPEELIESKLIKKYLEIWFQNSNYQEYNLTDDQIKKIVKVWKVINKYRKIGPAIIEDICKYLTEDNDFASAIIMYVLAQFEGLSDIELVNFYKEVEKQVENSSEIKSFLLNYFDIEKKSFKNLYESKK